MESLIIDRPSRRTLKQKYIDNSLKVIMLLGWLYLCLPAITFGVWYIAYTFFNQHLILLEGYKEYKSITSLWYLIVIANMLVLILAWSKGKQLYSKNKQPTHEEIPLSEQDVSAYYQLPTQDILRFRKMKNMIVSFDDSGRIVEVTSS